MPPIWRRGGFGRPAARAAAGLVFILLFGIRIFAEPPSAADPSASPPAVRPGASDRWHQGLTTQFNSMADTLDRTISAQQESEQEAEADCRAGAIAFIGKDGLELTGRFSARLTLPRTSRQFQILLDDRRLEQDSNPFDDPLYRDQFDRFFKSVPFLRRFRTIYGIRANLSLHPTVGPYIKGYLKADGWVMTPSVLLYWHGGEGFGLRGRYDLEKQISSTLRLQLAPQAVWSEETDGVRFQQGVSLTRPAGGDAILGADGVVSMSTGASSVLDNVTLSVRYRRRVWREWLFVEASPQIEFPRDEDYKITPGFTLRADVLFR